MLAEHARVFCWRAGDLIQLTPADAPVRPGDQLVVDAGHSLTRRGVVVESPPAFPHGFTNNDPSVDHQPLPRLARMSLYLVPVPRVLNLVS
jgi:hypothetical protein